MKVPFFDLKKQYTLIQKEVEAALQNTFSQSQFVGGSPVQLFERAFEKKLKCAHCIATGNGTDSLFIALKSLDIGAGDEVITPAWSWISSAETISLTGARPVFADVDDFFTIDSKSIARKITPQTKAIVAVHLYGQLADMESIKLLCKKNNLYLIEDCAQAHFSSWNGQMAGTFGDLAAFSFYPTKNLGAYGDAGAVVTGIEALAILARRLANHGGLSKDDHQIEGFNSRMDTIQAAALNVKLKYVDGWNALRIRHAKHYLEKLSSISDLVLPSQRENTHHTYHLFVVRTSRRDELKAFLAQHEVETSIHYPSALPFEPAYRHMAHREEDFPVAASLQREVLSLPIYPELTDDEVGFVCQQIINFFND